MKITFEQCPCTRCGGTGSMPYSVYGGVCFKCNGVGHQLTPAGRSAHALYESLIAEASVTVQAWQVAVGDTVTYASDRMNRWFLVETKDFSSSTGTVVDGRCLGSAMLGSSRTVHCTTPDTLMKIKPSSATICDIMRTVASRRRGATIVQSATVN